MKNVKRAVAVFVSAIMVMAMLAGCGGTSGTTSTADKLRSLLGADQSVTLDSVASEIASGSYTSNNIKAVLQKYNYDTTDFEFEDGTATTSSMSVIASSSSASICLDFVYIEKVYGTEQQILAGDSSTVKAQVDALKSDVAARFAEAGATSSDIKVYVALEKAGTNSWILAAEIAITVS